MKNLILTVLVLGMGLGLAACGKKGDLEPPERQGHLVQPL